MVRYCRVLLKLLQFGDSDETMKNGSLILTSLSKIFPSLRHCIDID